MAGKVDIVSDPNASTTISLNGTNATITAGGNGQHGILSMHDSSTSTWPRVLLNANTGNINMTRPLAANESGLYVVIGLHSSTADVSIGGNGQDGDLVLFPAALVASDPSSDKTKATIHLRASDGIVRAGGGGVDGRVLVLAKDNSARISLEGSSGDIILTNADCAEDFDVVDQAQPGTVMALDGEGRLRQSDLPYDKRVAGVISGAGEYRPAILLDRRVTAERRLPVALVGKVYCKVDADFGAIEPGDLLTTAPTPGHAMKASDPARAFGSVLGKALRPLPSGRGMLPILVALQ